MTTVNNHRDSSAGPRIRAREASMLGRILNAARHGTAFDAPVLNQPSRWLLRAVLMGAWSVSLGSAASFRAQARLNAVQQRGQHVGLADEAGGLCYAMSSCRARPKDRCHTRRLGRDCLHAYRHRAARPQPRHRATSLKSG